MEFLWNFWMLRGFLSRPNSTALSFDAKIAFF